MSETLPCRPPPPALSARARAFLALSDSKARRSRSFTPSLPLPDDSNSAMLLIESSEDMFSASGGMSVSTLSRLAGIEAIELTRAGDSSATPIVAVERCGNIPDAVAGRSPMPSYLHDNCSISR
jgi:hypothetical protein